jgi:hypothetical protein
LGEIHIRMITPFLCISCGEQPRWIIVCSSRLSATLQLTVHTTCILSVMPNTSVYRCHARSIGGAECEKGPGYKYTVHGCVPNAKSFLLESGEVMEAGEYEAIGIFWLARTTNYPASKIYFFL